MTGFNKRIYEMLTRVLVFSKTYPHLFAGASRSAGLIDEIAAAGGKLSAEGISKASGKRDAKALSRARAEARKNLRDQLVSISRTAKGLRLSQFWMPRDSSDRALIEFGHIFSKNAQPLSEVFVESHLAPDFIEKLDAAVQNLDGRIRDQVVVKAARISATAAAREARNEAFAALQSLDPLMENLLQDDSQTLAVWQNARRVERSASRKPAESEPQAEPDVEVTSTDAAA